MNRDRLTRAAGGRRASRRGADPRSHHIADVAHHFLADAPAAPPCIFVAGPAAGTGLALELAGDWARTAGAPVGFMDSAPAPVAAEARTGIIMREPARADRAGDEALVWHLGHPDRRRLDDLDAVGRVPGARRPGAGLSRGILWCAAAADLESWSLMVGLGRLAGALRTSGAAVLLVPGGRTGGDLQGLRARADRATGTHTGIVALPEPARAGARAAALGGLPALIFPSAT